MAEPEQDRRLGTVLQDRYKILARIAAGGMGTVYRGERVGLGRRVAIKFLHATFASDKEFLRRFEVEARAMSRLSHPHCVSVIDFGVADAPYMVLDYADGETLRALLDRGPVAPRRALAIIRQVLAGLAHAHAQGIVHRDVKPANIVLDEATGTGEHARLLDFGLAKLHDANASQDHSLGSIAVGTPGYMSPEQVRGERVDGRADVYATGLLLYELITGQRMFTADEAWEVLKKHLEQPPARIRDTMPGLGVSAELEAALARSLAKKADDRFQSAAEFAAALDATPEGAARASMSGRLDAGPPLASVPPAVPVPPEASASPIDDSASLDLLAKASTLAMPVARATTPTPVALLSREGAATAGDSSPPRPAGGVGLARGVGLVLLVGALGSGVWWWSQHASTGVPARNGLAPTGAAPLAPPGVKRPGVREPTPSAGLTPPAAATPDALAAAVLAPGLGDASAPDASAVDANETDAGPAEAIPPEERAEPVAPVPDENVPEEAIDPAPTPSPAPAPRPVVTRVEDVTPLIDAGRTEEAIAALVELRRKLPKSAYVPYLLGNLYFDKKWWTDGMVAYRQAIAINRGYRSRGILIRNVIRALDSAKTRGAATTLLRSTIGNAALPELRRAAKGDKSPVVRANAAALVKQLTRPRGRF